MPYIPPERRQALDAGALLPVDPGELNYVITRTVEQYRVTHGDSYQTFNDILGALSGATQEFYRRVVAPYEDTKRDENGDVYAPSTLELRR